MFYLILDIIHCTINYNGRGDKNLLPQQTVKIDILEQGNFLKHEVPIQVNILYCLHTTCCIAGTVD